MHTKIGRVAVGTSNEVTVAKMDVGAESRCIILDSDGEPASVLTREQARELSALLNLFYLGGPQPSGG